MHTVQNQIINYMPFVVTKEGLIEARFRSICDAKDFYEFISQKYPATKWEVMFQYYNEKNCLLSYTWGTDFK